MGVLAAGIPLLIHLWNRRRAKVVSFSSIRFLMARHRRRIKRLKLKQILILILRMLVIILIALALARPILKSKWALAAGARAKSSVVIILDNSYSMSYERFDGRRFDIAKDKALRLLESLRPGDNVSLILMSDVPEVVFKRLTSDVKQVRDAIEDARVSHRSSYVWPSVWEAYSLLKESDSPRKVIYLISDLGENGWQNWKEMPADMGMIDIFVVRIGDLEADNLAVESIRLSGEPVGMGMPVDISAKLKGIRSEINTVAELFVDGEKKGQAVADKELVSFAHTFEYPGTHLCEVRLTFDRLTMDDVRYFAVNVLGQIRVLNAGDYSFYLNLALNPVTSLNPEEEFLILPVASTVEELGTLSLDQYSVLTLVDATELPVETVRKLESFVLNGGNVVIFIGENANLSWYNSNFDLMPATLENRISLNRSRPLKLSSWSEEHPIFKAFREGTAADALADSAEFYSAFSLKPKSSSNVIARFDRDIPAILETKAGLGRIILFNTSPDMKVSSLPLSPVFLPLMQQTIFYLVSEESNGRNILVGDTYIQHAKEGVESTPEIVDPENNSAIPVLSASERGNQIEYGPVDRAGVYKLEFKSGGRLRRDYFAANLDTTGESYLKAAKDEKVTDALGESARFISADEPPEEIVRSAGGESEISSRLLVAAVILMLLEIPLANRRRVE